jgi:hypothetical protein
MDATEEERSFIHGDAHPYYYLVAPEPQKGNFPLSVCFINWEYARIGKGVSNDFAVAVAWFALMEIAAAHRSESMSCAPSKRALLCIRAFTRA